MRLAKANLIFRLKAYALCIEIDTIWIIKLKVYMKRYIESNDF